MSETSHNYARNPEGNKYALSTASRGVRIFVASWLMLWSLVQQRTSLEITSGRHSSDTSGKQFMKTYRIQSKCAALAVAIACLIPLAVSAEVSLVSTGSVWKYLDDGTDQGTAWRA